MKLKVLQLLFFLFLFTTSYSQTDSIEVIGSILDGITNTPLNSIKIKIRSKINENHTYYLRSNDSGFFTLKLAREPFEIIIIKKGFDTIKEDLAIESKLILNYRMVPYTKNLDEIVILKKQEIVKLKGDTIEHSASNYKLNSDATIEDLVKKLPGTTIENGVLKSNGEEIKKITIDGRDFFGEDVALTLKTLPADIVGGIQVYDRQSDQSSFTGFSDGNTSKSMNIKTKNGMKKGVFGKAYSGIGLDEKVDKKHNLGGSINYFNEKRRISLISNNNNINQQNFSYQDILGVLGKGGGGGMMRRMSSNPKAMQGMMSSMPGGSEISDYFTTQQNGINKSNSVGINYSDMIGKKITIATSYFFNKKENVLNDSLLRSYFLKNNETQLYNEKKNSTSINGNHRINLRLTYLLDSLNTIIFNPRFSIQGNDGRNKLKSNTSYGNMPFNEGENTNIDTNKGYMLSFNTTFNHRFKKPGRTISINFSLDQNQSNSINLLQSKNTFYNNPVLKNQETNSDAKSQNYNASITYTEKIRQNSQLLFSISPSLGTSNQDRKTTDFDSLKNNYEKPVKSLSNTYENKITTHKAGLFYAFNKSVWNINIGTHIQVQELAGKQLFPDTFVVTKPFSNLLPVASVSYKVEGKKSIKISYRTATNIPAISQLQNVLNNTNPTYLTIGNPNLTQQYDHIINLRYHSMKQDKGGIFVAYLNYRLSQGYIGNSTSILFNDTLINGYTIPKGAQLSRYENLTNASVVSSFINYARKIEKIKCNINLSSSINYSLTPTIINGISNRSKSSSINNSISVVSNLSEKIDFTFSYANIYSIALNSIQSNNSHFLYETMDIKCKWNFYSSFYIESDYQGIRYQGLESGFNQKINLLTSSLSYKFLPQKGADLKFTVFDILGQNKSIGRTMNVNYIEDNNTQVLQRYYLLTFTYTLKTERLKKGSDEPKK